MPDALSRGRKATAALPLLPPGPEAPPVVDRPGDDLDNRFVTEGIVPIVRREKRRRQFVSSTRNANVPASGDAGLVLGLTASGEAEEGQEKMAPERTGSVESGPARELVEETPEGGRDAFGMRRSGQGFRA